MLTRWVPCDTMWEGSSSRQGKAKERGDGIDDRGTVRRRGQAKKRRRCHRKRRPGPVEVTDDDQKQGFLANECIKPFVVTVGAGSHTSHRTTPQRPSSIKRRPPPSLGRTGTTSATLRGVPLRRLNVTWQTATATATATAPD